MGSNAEFQMLAQQKIIDAKDKEIERLNNLYLYMDELSQKTEMRHKEELSKKDKEIERKMIQIGDMATEFNAYAIIQKDIIEQKDEEIERYRKALEFYADTRKWGVTCSDDLPDFQDSDDNEELRNDDNQRITKGGKTARQALGGDNDNN